MVPVGRLCGGVTHDRDARVVSVNAEIPGAWSVVVSSRGAAQIFFPAWCAAVIHRS
ncbi:hypothetical protein [Nocardia flavorosea]|uniref:Uncharacterized protein n=1 Tax=Nocardia flavorosea TaxID=53429 RepID=A0A846YJQ8_9NOCA|nr:hypothetical protein [Nocardia flavorosea]NKY59113.1 hypothetical protein [Nocardia flavorosea]